MKRAIFLTYLFCCSVFLAQSKMYIHKSGNVTLGIPVSASIKYGSNDLTVRSGSISSQIALREIDSISFNADSDTIRINYNGNSVSITNPLAFENVSVNTTNAKVVITSTSAVKNLNYKISGSTQDGMLKIYSTSKFNLIFNNLSLTNTTGPAINIQSGSTTSVVLPNGTRNNLTDGASYSDTFVNESNTTEDQNAAFFAKGNLYFSGTGSLTINGIGADKHGVYTKDEMKVSGSVITVNSASKDGIHPKDGFTVESGIIKITSTGDAIDADEGFVKITGGTITTNTKTAEADGISSLTTMDISNAEINITVAGDKAKGLKSGQNINLGSGNFTINTSGNVLLEASGSGYEPSYCTAIKSDSTITINGSNIVIKSTGIAGKGISADKDILISSGTINITSSGAGGTYTNSTAVKDSYHSTCIGADGNLTILGGTITTSSSGTAGRGITADGTITFGDATNSPTLNLTTTGTKILVSGSGNSAEYDEAKTLSCDGALTINNGLITISSADDAIKSDLSITINNGTININKSVEGIESVTITINNGAVNITSTDDGINSTKGVDGESSDGSCLYINGGTINLTAPTGDGIDSNGNIVMTGGTVVVNGPSSQPEVALDYNGTFNISGGFLLASGPNSGNMIEATSTTSVQYAIKATTTSLLSTSTIFNLQDAAGNSLVTFKPLRNTYYIVFSSPDLKSGSTYNIYTGGTSTGTYTNGLYIGGSYSGGTLKKSFSITGKVTSVAF